MKQYFVFVKRDWLMVAPSFFTTDEARSLRSQNRELMLLHMQDLVGFNTHFRCGKFFMVCPKIIVIREFLLNQLNTNTTQVAFLQ